MKTSWRRLSSSEDVFKTSWSRRICLPQPYVFRRRHQDVLVKTNIFVLAIPLPDVFKTPSRRLQGVLQKGLQDIFKTSSTRFENVFKTSSRHLQGIFKTYHQVKLFLLTRLWEAFNTFLRRSVPKTIIYRGICPGNTTDKFMVSVKNLQEK